MPTNPIATCKVCIVRCRREEAIAKSWPYGQELDMKAYTVGKMAKDIKDPKGNRNPCV